MKNETKAKSEKTKKTMNEIILHPMINQRLWNDHDAQQDY